MDGEGGLNGRLVPTVEAEVGRGGEAAGAVREAL